MINLLQSIQRWNAALHGIVRTKHLDEHGCAGQRVEAVLCGAPVQILREVLDGQPGLLEDQGGTRHRNEPLVDTQRFGEHLLGVGADRGTALELIMRPNLGFETSLAFCGLR